jgi:hypothetical protein
MNKENKKVYLTVGLILLIFLILCVLYFLGYNPTDFVYQRF